MPSRTDVLVVCGDAARAHALKVLLDMAGYSVSWTASPAEIDSEEVLVTAACILLDSAGMTAGEVGEAMHLLRERSSVILIADEVDLSRGARHVKSGAFDVFDAGFSPSALLNSLEAALVSAARSLPSDLSGFVELTPREQEVLRPLVHGYSAKAIGETLGISPRTVEAHRARILEKLGARNLPDLVRIVVERSPRTRAGGPH